MEIDTKEIFLTRKDMDKDHYSFKMENIMWVNGLFL